MMKFPFPIKGPKENWKELRYDNKEAAKSFWKVQRTTKNQHWISVKKEKEDCHILIFASVEGL